MTSRARAPRSPTPTARRWRAATDAAGRLASLTVWLGKTTTFGHDANDNHTATTSPNATASAMGFDDADRLTSVGHARSGTTFARFAYTRDKLGLLASTTPSGVAQPNESYTYTALDQLKTVNSRPTPTTPPTT